MALIIDGYNLLNATAITGRGDLQSSRAELLRFLATAISPAELRRTIVVFDSRHAPPGLPTATTFSGMRIRFAKGYRDADELIEQLIQQDTAPRQLTVVSSDHQIQRAAKRRRATAVDSDVWYRRTVAQTERVREDGERQELDIDDEAIEQWLDAFCDPDRASRREMPDLPLPTQSAKPGTEDVTSEPLPAECGPEEGDRQSVDSSEDGRTQRQLKDDPIFPPGYGDDLLQDNRHEDEG